MYHHTFTTSALPYPNGYLHLGHILEFIQTDIWVKYKSLHYKTFFYFSGIDTHGTPIMLKAQTENTSPEKLIIKFFLSYKKNLLDLNIFCNNFYSTNSYENEILSRKFFYKLYEKHLIFIKNIYQFYDPIVKIFLPDRYIRGNCPKCNETNQYGDTCEKCNFNYEATDLITPISKLTGITPIKLITNHYFFALHKFKKFLKNWSKKNLTQKEIYNKLKEWFETELIPWNISRNKPYFGIKIPSEYKKFFYVWMDAPLGYFASSQNFFLKSNINFFYYFLKLKTFTFYHFIGKDIIYFHTLFWIIMLKLLKFKLPVDVFVHGFLTMHEKKMSKSNIIYITANKIIKKFNPDYIRFYFATKLNNKITDIDFNINDFCNKINSILIGKFINILSRLTKIIKTHYKSRLSDTLNSFFLYQEYTKIYKVIKNLYNKRKYNDIIKLTLKYAEKINLYIEKEKPWNLYKNNITFKRGHNVCTTGLNLFFILLFYLKPIIPKITKDIENIFNINLNKKNIIKNPYLSCGIKVYRHVTYKFKLTSENYKNDIDKQIRNDPY